MAKQHRHVVCAVDVVPVAETAGERHGEIDHFGGLSCLRCRVDAVRHVRIVRIEHGQEVIELGVDVLEGRRGGWNRWRYDRRFVLLVGEDLVDHFRVMLHSLASTAL